MSLLHGKVTALFWVPILCNPTLVEIYSSRVPPDFTCPSSISWYFIGPWDRGEEDEVKSCVVVVNDAEGCTQREKSTGTPSALLSPVNLQLMVKNRGLFLRLDSFYGSFAKWNTQILFHSSQVNSIFFFPYFSSIVPEHTFMWQEMLLV